MNDQTIEQELQAKGLTAPRVTPEEIASEIASEYYFTGFNGVAGELMSDGVPPTLFELRRLPEALGLLTFCVLILRNGHRIVGVNEGPVVAENFDAEIGRRLARQDAIAKVWPLLGFRLRDRLAG
jgi:hypothetical protein